MKRPRIFDDFLVGGEPMVMSTFVQGISGASGYVPVIWLDDLVAAGSVGRSWVFKPLGSAVRVLSFCFSVALAVSP